MGTLDSERFAKRVMRQGSWKQAPKCVMRSDIKLRVNLLDLRSGFEVCSTSKSLRKVIRAMTDERVRSWQEIAQEAFREKDPKRLIEMIEELARALDARDHKSEAARAA
jgi:hypothetical protein